MCSLPDYATDMNAVLKDSAKWIKGSAPDYSIVNKLYFDSKTVNHSTGSLADIVTNLVKNWEKEVSHKTDPKEWRTVDIENYKFSTNGGKWLNTDDMVRLGTYRALIGDSEHFMSSRISLEESHQIFHNCLTEGFAWECLEVLSPPPRVAFKWRHWGKMTGILECPMRTGQKLVAQPTNQFVQIFGMTIAEVDDKLQIIKLETYFNPNEILQQLAKNQVSPKE